MYPNSDKTIVTMTARISMRSFQEELFGSDSGVENFIRLLLEKYVSRTSDLQEP
jgi:hypothetical protein